ncbi:MAG: glutaredoxin family protein [Acidobacteria bacterium]|nr:glutaredoxin family protein [Acidobacteriota bacterium]
MPCNLAKEFLRARGVEFDDINVDDLADPWETIRALTGGPFGTPTVVIEGEARVGFDAAWIGERLGLTDGEKLKPNPGSGRMSG